MTVTTSKEQSDILIWHKIDALRKECDDLKADNERLRAALEAVRRHNDNPARYDEYVEGTTRAALEGKDGG